MGSKFSNIEGYGKTEVAALECLKRCFIYNYGEREWVDCYITKVSLDKVFEIPNSEYDIISGPPGTLIKRIKETFISNGSSLHGIGFQKVNNQWRCFIME